MLVEVRRFEVCKMAWGQMVRWLAESNITNRADIRGL